ncbi:unnamed protein product [Closterium sp. NIES-54]
MCGRDDTRLAPSSSPIFANSTFATTSDGERRTLVSSSGAASAEPRPLPPKLSAWSRLTPDVLSATRAPSSGGARSTPRREPSKHGPCVEPALLLLPDGSVQIVCSSQAKTLSPSAHSQTGSQTRTLTAVRNMKKSTNHGARDPSRVAPSTDMHSISDNSISGNSVSSESIPRTTNHDAGRRATRVSDVLQDHPGCQVGSLTSSHGFLRPQHVLKPGHVYFLQPPLALPAPHDHGTSFYTNGYDAFDDGGSSALLIQDVDACNEDDNNHGRRWLEDVVASFSGSSGRISEFDAARSSGNSAENDIFSDSARSTGSLSTLSALSAFSASSGPLSALSSGTAGVQDPLFLPSFPSSSLYRTPCACCNDGLPAASTSRASHSLNHAHSLPPSASATVRVPSPSPSPPPPMIPPSPFADSPHRRSRSTRGHSRLGQKNTPTAPENPGDFVPAAHAFTAAAAQESCSSHLMHRGWCAASRGANLESWTSMCGKSGKSWFNCNSSADAAGAMENYQALFEALETASSTPVRRFDSSNGSGNSSTSISSSNSNIGTLSASSSSSQVPFRVRGRAVITAEDMVFGCVGPSVA